MRSTQQLLFKFEQCETIIITANYHVQCSKFKHKDRKQPNNESIHDQRSDFGRMCGRCISWTTHSLVKRMAEQKCCLPTLLGSRPFLWRGAPAQFVKGFPLAHKSKRDGFDFSLQWSDWTYGYPSYGFSLPLLEGTNTVTETLHLGAIILSFRCV